jgi:hypothetical protein
MSWSFAVGAAREPAPCVRRGRAWPERKADLVAHRDALVVVLQAARVAQALPADPVSLRGLADEVLGQLDPQVVAVAEAFGRRTLRVGLLMARDLSPALRDQATDQAFNDALLVYRQVLQGAIEGGR